MRNLARQKRLELWQRDGPYCQLCGRRFASFRDKDLTLDHIHPQFLGGGHDISNLRLACSRCNLNYANKFKSLIALKQELVLKERRQPGSNPKQKYVLVVSPSSATYLMPKGTRILRDLMRRMPLIRPSFAAANTGPGAAATAIDPAAVAAPPPPSPFALSPNVDHAANNQGGEEITPLVSSIAVDPAHHRASGTSWTARPTHSPPPCDIFPLYEPMDLSD
jgi:HNH endonuclease